jgi:hypothetical protein
MTDDTYNLITHLTSVVPSKLLYLCQQPAVTWSHEEYDSLTGVQLQPEISVLVDNMCSTIFVHNLNFTG